MHPVNTTSPEYKIKRTYNLIFPSPWLSVQEINPISSLPNCSRRSWTSWYSTFTSCSSIELNEDHYNQAEIPKLVEQSFTNNFLNG